MPTIIKKISLTNQNFTSNESLQFQCNEKSIQTFQKHILCLLKAMGPPKELTI